nr:MAG TPA: hypothetical protein [Ackermannviridae sp.]
MEFCHSNCSHFLLFFILYLFVVSYFLFTLVTFLSISCNSSLVTITISSSQSTYVPLI